MKEPGVLWHSRFGGQTGPPKHSSISELTPRAGCYSCMWTWLLDVSRVSQVALERHGMIMIKKHHNSHKQTLAGRGIWSPQTCVWITGDLGCPMKQIARGTLVEHRWITQHRKTHFQPRNGATHWVWRNNREGGKDISILLILFKLHYPGTSQWHQP